MEWLVAEANEAVSLIEASGGVVKRMDDDRGRCNRFADREDAFERLEQESAAKPTTSEFPVERQATNEYCWNFCVSGKPALIGFGCG